MTASVTTTKDEVALLLRGVRNLTKRETLVGVPDITAGRTTAGPMNNATIGYIQENGAPEAHIPPRPFLVPGVQSVLDKIATVLEASARKTVQGDPDAGEQSLVAIGLIAQNAVQAKITNGPFVPLAPATIAKRKARGLTRTKPLIDTGALRQAIRYVIRRKGT